MRKYITALFASLFLLFGAASNVYAGSDIHQQGVKLATYKLTVSGMTCPFCVRGIEKRIKKIDGVLDIHSDLDAGTIVIDAKDKTIIDEARAKKEITAAGFTLTKFEVLSKEGVATK